LRFRVVANCSFNLSLQFKKKQKDLHSLMVAEVALNNSQVTMVKQHRLNLLLILIRILTRMKEEDN
jgi:hypothetical protein